MGQVGINDERSERLLRQALLGISVATVASGGLQIVAPGLVLRQLDAARADTDRHLFATVGMFMVVVGGLLAHDLVRHDDDPTVLLWAGLQKVGAAGAVAIGVRHGVFARRALAVAGFDAISGLGCLAYRTRVRRTRPSIPVR
ncbi:MAG: hypothetical protein QOF30_3360 [Acidimicrobiaceae bacterium]|jgi:hypothetical protein|nr:hypothetical protein [Acidimicrobiaceae bacterium]